MIFTINVHHHLGEDWIFSKLSILFFPHPTYVFCFGVDIQKLSLAANQSLGRVYPWFLLTHRIYEGGCVWSSQEVLTFGPGRFPNGPPQKKGKKSIGHKHGVGMGCLGGGFIFLNFHRYLGKMNPFWPALFSRWRPWVVCTLELRCLLVFLRVFVFSGVPWYDGYGMFVHKRKTTYGNPKRPK